MPPTETVYLIRDYPIPDVPESVKVAGAAFGEAEIKFKPFQIFLFASLVPKEPA